MQESNNKYDNLTKDELIALLEKKDKEINKQNNKKKYLEKKLLKKEKQYNKQIAIDKVELNKAYKAIGFLVSKLEEKEIKLKEQLCERFGIKSDKYEIVNGIKVEKDETLVNEAEVIIDEVKKAPKKRGRKPRTLDCQKFNKDIVEYEEVKIDQNKDRLCDVCNSSLVFQGTRKYQKVEVIPAKVKLTEYIVYTYKCMNCGQTYDLDEPINTFDNESFLTPSLASYIVNNKYNLALPLYRQESMLKQLGAPISRQSMANYCIVIADKLMPIYDKMKVELLSNTIIIKHADETTYRVIKSGKLKSYMWLYASSMYDLPIYIYEYQRTREAIHPQEFLSGYKGYLMCDDYSGYENIDGVVLCRCWFHAKKKYADLVKTLDSEQKASSKALEIHNMISEFFDIDNRIHNKAKSTDEIKNERLRLLKPKVDNYFKYIKEIYEKVDKTSKLGIAIKYSIKNEPDLCRFFENGQIPLTNNLALSPTFYYPQLSYTYLDLYKKLGDNFFILIQTSLPLHLHRPIQA